jgi:hypothetical protein
LLELVLIKIIITMPEPTPQQRIENVTAEIRSALLEEFDASQAEEQSKIAKAKAHNRVLKAKEELSALNFN